MRTLVLDTSVAVAWYLPESFQPEARRWQRRMLDEEVRLVVPGLHYWEVANVLRTYVRRGELGPDLAADLYDLHLQAPLGTAEPRRETVLDVALDYGATAYDAVYVALSLELDVPLVTAERTTTPWVIRLGERVEPVRAG
jgi:predicted nucleic acid-binding protein